MDQEQQAGAGQESSPAANGPSQPSPELQPQQIAAVLEQALQEQQREAAESRANRRGDQEQQRGLFGIQAFFTVVIFSIFVITFIVQAFQIPSGSMENTLLIGDFLLVDKLHFAGEAAPGKLLPYGKIERGDIIVFYYPVDPKQFLVKRVIGVPGDHVRIRNRIVYVNGAPLHENYVIHKQWVPEGYRDNFPSRESYSRDVDKRWRYQLQNYIMQGEIVVPQGQYFVLGDNRDQSLDSRYWGFVPRANIIGRPLVIYLSVAGSGDNGPNDKLLHSGQIAHWLHFARWDRMFRLVR
jgi:signal peptidase I